MTTTLESEMNFVNVRVTENPTKHDILYSRGTLVNKHFGNVRLCALVKERSLEYITSNYADAKEIIIRQMIEELSEDGGRFLDEAEDGSWQLSHRQATQQRIQEIFHDYTSALPSQTTTTSVVETTQLPPPQSPPSLDAPRRLPPKTVTPPELSPRSIPLRRREALPPTRDFQYPSLSPPSNAARHRHILESDRSYELARALYLRKQQERRLLVAMRAHQEIPARPSALHPSIRTTSMGKRRQIDPLAPHRKRKTPRPDGSSSESGSKGGR